MKLKIELFSDKPVVFPRGYNEYLQAMIYNNIDKEQAQWLHDKGYAYEKRSFKLFVFSDIIEYGQYNNTEKTITFPSSISFFVSSPVDWILEQIAKNIISSEQVMLGINRLSISSIAVIKQPDITAPSMKIKALSPIEVHTTFELHNGKKKTHYYTPYEEEFSELVNSNLKKKWKAFYNDECLENLKIVPLFSGNKNERIRYFGTGPNKTLIKGWTGYYRLEGSIGLQELALDAGLGSRNSQGFGMVELVSEQAQNSSNKN